MAPTAARRSASPKDGSELSGTDALAQVSFLVTGALGRRAGAHGMSIIQTRLLGVLRDRTPSINQLSELLELDKSSVSGLVDRAEARGLVTRVRSTGDRRSVQVTLTGDGRSLVSEVAEEFEGDVAQMLVCLTPAQREALSRLLERMVRDYAGRRGVDISADRAEAQWDRR